MSDAPLEPEQVPCYARRTGAAVPAVYLTAAGLAALAFGAGLIFLGLWQRELVGLGFMAVCLGYIATVTGGVLWAHLKDE